MPDDTPDDTPEDTLSRPHDASTGPPIADGQIAESIAEDLALLGTETAMESRAYLGLLRQIAAGASPESAIPLLLPAVSQVLVSGARLGAITDIVPSERFEPDLGSDEDVEQLRNDLAAVLVGLDDYVEVVDPMTTTEVSASQLSGDLTDIASALLHGLRHHAEGRISEALWWWQFSYLSSWGARAASALRALQSVISHIRLDVDEDVAAEAQFEALHGD